MSTENCTRTTDVHEVIEWLESEVYAEYACSEGPAPAELQTRAALVAIAGSLYRIEQGWLAYDPDPEEDSHAPGMDLRSIRKALWSLGGE